MRRTRVTRTLLAGGAVLGIAATLLARHPVHPAGGVEVATARVRSVSPLSRLESMRRAGRLTPRRAIEVVLQVAPAEGGDSVLATDVIDSGSVADLTTGVMEQVFYPEANPASARMIRGTRSGLPGAWGLVWTGVLFSFVLIIVGRYRPAHP